MTLRWGTPATPDGRLLGIDADAQALDRTRQRLQPFANRVTFANDNFEHIGRIAEQHGFHPVLGVLMDLGLSSWQLDTAGRGFSFRDDVPADMRLSADQPLTAADVVNTYSQDELARVIATYGEEPQARRIAQAIVRHRPIGTALQLAQAVESAVPRRGRRTHPATRTFLAIRIVVNRELDVLESALRQAVRLLAGGGRLAVIAYHSLEDRVVKTFMRTESSDCICPPGLPMCACDHKASVRVLTKRVVKPSSEEVRNNPRVRSAKLRACVAS